MKSGRSSKLGENHNQANTSPHLLSRQTVFCSNHPKKVATYFLIDDHDQLNYCQKCSIMLASQGFDVNKIDCAIVSSRSFVANSRQNDVRVEEVQTFLREVGSEIDKIHQKEVQIEEMLKNSQVSYLKSMADITQFFKEVETILQVQKYTIYNSLLTHRSQLQSQLRSTREALTLEMQNLIMIGTDIENNMEAVQTVEASVYETIMNNYRSKLEGSYEVSQKKIQKVCFPSCVIGDIPSSLYTIADIIQLQNYSGPTPSPKRKGQQTPISLVKREDIIRPAFSLPCLNDLYHRDSQEEENYSFDNSTSQVHPILFREGQRKLMPNQVPIRQSLNLTQIRQNEDEILMMRRFANLQQTIPEEMQSSRESIEGYLVGNIEEDCYNDLKVDSRVEDTETMLLN